MIIPIQLYFHIHSITIVFPSIAVKSFLSKQGSRVSATTDKLDD